MLERRKYVRSNGLVLLDYQGEAIEGKSSAFDVSGVGVRITVDRELRLDSSVDLRIYLPGDSQPIKVRGQIVWTQKCKKVPKAALSPEKAYFYAGIRFSNLIQHDRKKITGYVSRRLRQA